VGATETELFPHYRPSFLYLSVKDRTIAHMAMTSLTLAGHGADSPAPLLRPSACHGAMRPICLTYTIVVGAIMRNNSVSVAPTAEEVHSRAGGWNGEVETCSYPQA